MVRAFASESIPGRVRPKDFLDGIASTFEWLEQLDSKTEKVTSLPPGQGTLTNK